MSVLRGAFERRSYPFPFTAPDVTGTTGWQSGMVWNGYAPGGGTPQQAMYLSAVFACLRLLSEAISTLPLDTYIRSQGARRPYRPRPAYLDFGQPGLSRIDYLSQVMLSLLTHGNAYVLTPRLPDGTITNLIVLEPTMVAVKLIKGHVKYEVQGQSLDPMTDLMHIKGMCMPGQIIGLSPITYAAETVGVGLAAQRYGASFFENGAIPSFVVKAERDLGPQSRERWKESWNDNHRGLRNANRVGILTNGATIEKISIAPEEAQFLQTRQFTVPDIARVFGVPPHLIADASNSTSWGTGLAEQNLAFGQFSLRPWTERIEEAHGRLLTLDGLPDVFIKLNMDAVLRASLRDRLEAYKIAIETEIMVPNEARKLEDMAPVPWGDVPPPTVRREVVTAADSNVAPTTGPVPKGVPLGPGQVPASNGAKP